MENTIATILVLMFPAGFALVIAAVKLKKRVGTAAATGARNTLSDPIPMEEKRELFRAFASNPMLFVPDGNKVRIDEAATSLWNNISATPQQTVASNSTADASGSFATSLSAVGWILVVLSVLGGILLWFSR